ncbi:Uncharacterized protein Adt_24654 [Abeliophyllum distichum]|uniref:Zinc knuckle CX2CX4HX4C domain-containing protein n=1 Tax=Abeliophyllum distichum TaxID=126358 RepID=A0ABD1SHG9_9LAMI
MDVRIPLKRRMKLKKPGGEWIWVIFKYERVPTFCFICGKIGHSDSICEKLYEAKGEEIERPYGPFIRIRAPSQINPGLASERWLRGSSVENSYSNFGKNADYRVEDEFAMQGGENHSFANKGKGVAQGSIPNNPIPGILPPMLLNMKENPLFKEGSSGDSLFKEKNDNLGITIMDQKRRRMDNYIEVNLNNLAIDYEPMHDDPKNGATVGPTLQAH